MHTPKSPKEGSSLICIKNHSLVNEWYLRDCSRKISAVIQAKGRDGKPITNIPPYGYLKDPEDPNKWLIDEEAAAVVKRIFLMSADGKGPYEIARILAEEKIEKPSYYEATRGRGTYKNRCDLSHPYAWRGVSIVRMLEKPEYMGDTVNFRTYKESYKDKKGKKNEKENILIFRDTHEAIIDRKTWYMVQELRKTIRRADSAGEVNPLTGKVFCADCGAKMHYYREGTRAGKNWKGIPDGTVQKVPGRYDCSTYNQHRDWYERACCSHSIQTNALHPIILETIQYAINSAKIDEKAFAWKLRSESEIRDKGEITKLKRQISRQERRSRELDLLIKKIYEDNAVGKLPDKRFEMLFADYDKEQQELEVTITEAKEKIGQYESDSIRLEDFLELVHKYTDVKELTGTIVNEFIDKVMVHKAEMIDGERVMEIEVYLNCIGKIDLPIRELTPEEIAEHKEKLRIRERNRLYQRKRRAKYEARIKEIVEKEEAETKRRELRKAEKAAAAMMLDPDPLKTAAVVTGEHRTEVKTGVFLTPEEAREKFGDILDEKGYASCLS